MEEIDKPPEPPPECLPGSPSFHEDDLTNEIENSMDSRNNHPTDSEPAKPSSELALPDEQPTEPEPESKISSPASYYNSGIVSPTSSAKTSQALPPIPSSPTSPSQPQPVEFATSRRPDPVSPFNPQDTTILWDKASFHKRRSLVVTVPTYLTPKRTADTITAMQAARQLRIPEYLSKVQSYEGGLKGIILACGSVNSPPEDPMKQRGDIEGGIVDNESLKVMWSRGVMRAAMELHAMVVTSGGEGEIADLLGLSNRDRNHVVPMLGVVGRGLSTWPGDKTPNPQYRKPLQSDHTHFVLVETNNDLASVERLQLEVVQALQETGLGYEPWETKAEKEEVPVITFLAGGGQAELIQAARCCRRGWPIVVVRGSGGAADLVANQADNPHLEDHFPHEKVLEIVKEGTLEIIDLGETDGAAISDIIKRLFGGGTEQKEDSNIHLAWELHAVYKDNMLSMRRQAEVIRWCILMMGILITILVCVRDMLDLSGSGKDGYDAFLTILPILLSVLVLIENRFRFDTRAKVFESASMAIEQEIYQFRSGMGVYLSTSDEKQNDVLASRVTTIRNNVMGTNVAEGTITQTAAQVVRQRNFRVSPKDDGLSRLGPEDYVRLRLAVLIKSYEQGAASHHSFLSRSNNLVYLLGGVITVMAVFVEYQIFVAVAVALLVAITTHKDASGRSRELVAYNRAAASLYNTLAWWRSLPGTENIRPHKISELVRRVEEVHTSAMASRLPGTDMTRTPSSGAGGVSDKKGSSSSGFDVSQFVLDIQDHADKAGAITFKRMWMEAYPQFFVVYNQWLEAKMEREYAGKMRMLREENPDSANYSSLIDSDTPKASMLKSSSPRPGEEPQKSTLRTSYYSGVSGRGPSPRISKVEKNNKLASNPMPLEYMEGKGSPYRIPPSILWSSKDFYERHSKVVDVPPNMDVTEAVLKAELPKWMERHQGWSGGVRGVLVLVGLSDDLTKYLGENTLGRKMSVMDSGEAEHVRTRLDLLFSRGITKVAMETHSVVVTCGLETGAVKFMGRSNEQRHHRVPLLGVCGRGLCTWPGDRRPGAEYRTQLEKNHSHFMMVDTLTDQEGVTNFRMDVVKELVRNQLSNTMLWTGKQDNSALPVMVFVVNGDEAAEGEVVQCVRHGWPICVVRGTGGTADNIVQAVSSTSGHVRASATHDVKDMLGSSASGAGSETGGDEEEEGELEPKDSFNPRLVEIASEGHIEIVNVEDVEGSKISAMVDRLFRGGGTNIKTTDPSLVLAWEQASTYQKNADSADAYAHFHVLISLVLGVLATSLVCVLEDWENDFDDAHLLDAGRVVVILIPVLMGLGGSMTTLLKHKQRAAVLRGAASVAVTQIYEYRTSMMEYVNTPVEKRNDLLALRLKELRSFVAASVVSESALLFPSFNYKNANSTHEHAATFRQAEDDDGFSALTSEEYARVRLATSITQYQALASGYEVQYKHLQMGVYVLGGLGTFLAALQLFIYIAITVALAMALAAYTQHQRFADKVAFFNSAATELEALLTWWRALPSIQAANPRYFSQLVKSVEAVKAAEVVGLINPGTGGIGFEVEMEQSSQGLDLNQFKGDVAQHVLKNGTVKFKQGWVEKHAAFFCQYEDYLSNTGFYNECMTRIQLKFASQTVVQ